MYFFKCKKYTQALQYLSCMDCTILSREVEANSQLVDSDVQVAVHFIKRGGS